MDQTALLHRSEPTGNKPTAVNQMRTAATQSDDRGYQESWPKREISAYFRHICSQTASISHVSFFGYISSQTHNHGNCRSYLSQEAITSEGDAKTNCDQTCTRLRVQGMRDLLTQAAVWVLCWDTDQDFYRHWLPVAHGRLESPPAEGCTCRLVHFR